MFGGFPRRRHIWRNSRQIKSVFLRPRYHSFVVCSCIAAGYVPRNWHAARYGGKCHVSAPSLAGLRHSTRGRSSPRQRLQRHTTIRQSMKPGRARSSPAPGSPVRIRTMIRRDHGMASDCSPTMSKNCRTTARHSTSQTAWRVVARAIPGKRSRRALRDCGGNRASRHSSLATRQPGGVVASFGADGAGDRVGVTHRIFFLTEQTDNGQFRPSSSPNRRQTFPDGSKRTAQVQADR